MTPHDESPTRRIERRTNILTRPLILALIGVVVIVAGGVVWAVFARAPASVEGRGVVVPQGRTVVVRAPRSGVVTEVLVGASDPVEVGQAILRITGADGTTSAVGAHQAGAVIELRAAGGTRVHAGQLLAVITTDRRAHAAIAFMPAEPAESITPGMRALVSPANLPTAQYGAIEGVVTSLAPVPASTTRINALFVDNDSLTRYFTEQGPVLEVHVRLLTDPSTPSGFRWTVGDGPDSRVSAGTLAGVAVITDDASVASNLVR